MAADLLNAQVLAQALPHLLNDTTAVVALHALTVFRKQVETVEATWAAVAWVCFPYCSDTESHWAWLPLKRPALAASEPTKFEVEHVDSLTTPSLDCKKMAQVCETV